MIPNEGGPAFPVEATSTPWAPGLSKREWFAGMAMAGCGAFWFSNARGEPNPDATVAEWCFAVADAMITASGETK